MTDIRIAEWLLIAVTFMGPVFAVQAQKWIERSRERHSRRTWIFRTLMGTRASRLSVDHVHALNAIDLEYCQQSLLGITRHTDKDKAVFRAWHQYLDHLSQPQDSTAIRGWIEKSDDLFGDLLFALSQSLGYDFDKVSLMRSAYSPRAHGTHEDAQIAIRDNLVKVLSGAQPIPVVIIPLDERRASPGPG